MSIMDIAENYAREQNLMAILFVAIFFVSLLGVILSEKTYTEESKK